MPLLTPATRKGGRTMEADRPPLPAKIGSHLDAGAVALVGHEPNLSELTSILLTGNATRLSMEFKKGGVAYLQLDDNLRRGSALLRWFVSPKVLRSLAK